MGPVDDHLASIRRSAINDQRDGAPVRTIRLERSYPCDVAELWHAITSPDRLARWLGPVSVDARLGGAYHIEHNASGEILACEEPHRLEVSWIFDDAVSWVEATLTPDGARTILRLAHSAPVAPHPEATPATERFWATFGPGATGVGWELALLGLSYHLDPDLDKPDAGWEATPEATDFVRTVAAAWGESAAAGGEDADQARTAAERTTAFFTGAASRDDLLAAADPDAS